MKVSFTSKDSKANRIDPPPVMRKQENTLEVVGTAQINSKNGTTKELHLSLMKSFGKESVET